MSSGPARTGAVLLTLVALGGAAQPDGGPRALVYGGDQAFPPYEYLDARGEPAGLNVELIREVARVQGLSLTVRLMPWARVREELQAGRVDVAAMYRSPHRLELMDFAIAHELIYHELFVRRGEPPVSSIAELKGKKVLVEGQTYSDDALTALGMGPDLLRRPSEPEALEALARGEGEVAVVTQAVGRPFRGRAELAAKIAPGGPPVLLAEYAFVTLKGRPELTQLLSDGVARAKASGAYEAMYQRWINPDRSAETVRRVGWALAAAVVATVLVALWNRTLRRRVEASERQVRQEYEEKERVHQALEASERSLRTAQRLEAIGRLTGGVAHDFNNVLGIILNYTTFARDQLVEHRLPTADLDEVLAAAERAARLSRRLLTFSRSTPMETVRLDLGALVAGMRTLLQRLVGSSVVMTVEVPAGPVWVQAEASFLEQVLLNLGANARDAMPGGGTLAVRVEARAGTGQAADGVAAASHAALVVADDGTGIAPEAQERLFDPFFTTKEEGRGTGLGLATVMANVTRLGGTVGVVSAPGKGATFTVLLPLTTAPAEGPAASPPEVAVTGRGQRVLLADDDEALRRAARLSLERAGYQVVDAPDGRAALELADPPPDVLVTDVIMPHLGGALLAAELRRRSPGLKVLFVSGYVSQEAELHLDAPGTAFLSKPYAGPALAAAVGRLLG